MLGINNSFSSRVFLPGIPIQQYLTFFLSDLIILHLSAFYILKFKSFFLPLNKLLLSFLGDDVSRFFQPFLTRCNDVLLCFCIFDTTALRTTFCEDAPGLSALEIKVIVPCIVPEAAHAA